MATGFSVFVNIGAKVASSVGASVQKVENQFAAMGRHLKMASLETNLDLKGARGKLFEAAAAGCALERALGAPIKAAIEFESAMADVRKVVDFPTPQAFAQMGRDLTTMSLRLPMSAQGLAAITAAAGQAGIAGAELLPFTEMAAKVGTAFDISAGAAGDALAKLRTALNLSNPQVGLLADAMNKLSNEQASTASGILDVVNRVGAQGHLFGFTAVQTSAFASAMLSAGVETEVAATSFRNMGLALTHGTAATAGQKKAFKSLGLDATNVAKAMQKDAVGTTLDVITRLGKLPKYMQAAASSELFGNEARGLPVLFDNLELLKKSLGMVAKEADYAGSAQAEFDARSKTTANNVQLFRNHVESLGRTIGDALLPAFNSGMDALKPMLKGVDDFADKNKKLVVGAVGATAALVGFRVASIGLRYGAMFGKAAVLDMALAFWKVGAASKFGLGLALTPFRAIGRVALASGRQVALGFALMRAGALNLPGLLSGAAVMIAGSFRRITWAARAANLALASTAIGAGIVGLAAAGTFIYNNWDGIGRFFDSFGASVKKALGPETTAAFQPVIDTTRQALGVFQQLTGEISPDRWSAWGTAAGQSTSQFATDLQTVAGALKAVGDAWNSFSTYSASGPGDMLANTRRELDSLKASWTFLTTPLDFSHAFDGLRNAAAEIRNYDWAGLGRSIGSGIASGVSGMLSGMGARIKGMFGFGGGGSQAPATPSTTWHGPHRALGGPVGAGLPYLVGERGPELFVPGGSGRVYSAAATNRLAMAGSGRGAAPTVNHGPVTVNVTVHAKSGDSDGIGREVARQVRYEFARLQREQRGLLSD